MLIKCAANCCPKLFVLLATIECRFRIELWIVIRPAWSSVQFDIRELKQRGRRRQRQRRKIIGLMSKNNHSARAFYILVHFFAVLCKTTT